MAEPDEAQDALQIEAKRSAVQVLITSRMPFARHSSGSQIRPPWVWSSYLGAKPGSTEWP